MRSSFRECSQRVGDDDEAALHVEHAGSTQQIAVDAHSLESSWRKHRVKVPDEHHRSPDRGVTRPSAMVGVARAREHLPLEPDRLKDLVEQCRNGLAALAIFAERILAHEIAERVDHRAFPIRETSIEGGVLSVVNHR